MAEKNLNTFDNNQVIAAEDEILKQRRAKLFDQADADDLDNSKFGIALSGGGIRSATINMGFLKTLNNFGILKRADYLSTVSGGGYTGSYIQATIKNYKSYATSAEYKTFQRLNEVHKYEAYQNFKNKLPQGSSNGTPIAFTESAPFQAYKNDPEIASERKSKKFKDYSTYLEYRDFEPYRDFIQNKQAENFLAFKKYTAHLKQETEKNYQDTDAYRNFKAFSVTTVSSAAFKSCQELLDAEKYFLYDSTTKEKEQAFCDPVFIDYCDYLVRMGFDSKEDAEHKAMQSAYMDERDSFQQEGDYSYYKEMLNWELYYDFLEIKKAPDFEQQKVQWKQALASPVEGLKSYKNFKDYIDYRRIKEAISSLEGTSDYEAFLDYEALKNDSGYGGSKLFDAFKKAPKLDLVEAFEAEKNSSEFIQFKDFHQYIEYEEIKIKPNERIKGYIGYKELFTEEHLNYMRTHGEYLTPGTGRVKLWNQFVLVVSYVVGLLMSWISPAILILLGIGTYMILDKIIDFDNDLIEGYFGLIENNLFVISTFILGLLAIHYFSNVFALYSLNVSTVFSWIESALLLAAIVVYAIVFLLGIKGMILPKDLTEIFTWLAFGLILIVLGIFTNPNASSFHRVYRRQLANAYLYFAGDYQNTLLKDLFQPEREEDEHYLAPYPLVNTCLNLQSTNDKNFAGTKTSDYFLLSPKYCGAKLTGYVKTGESSGGYNQMSFPAAITISAAAINPGMGIYSNKVLAVMITILNLRLGFWAWNPLKEKKTIPIVWWPFYFIYEVFSLMGTNNKMLNISDGAHIENLAIYELLRRKCKLIIAVDAGEDPNYIFEDLENLTVRARNELGLELRFREDQIPEEVIRPKPSHGYSKQRFAIADIYQIWEKTEDKYGQEKIIHFKDKKIGMLVYVKSSVTAPEGRPEISREEKLKYATYKYKIYHPTFPHESTADQFFDEVQWEAYYQLGQFIAADVLHLNDLEYYLEQGVSLSVEELIDILNEKPEQEATETVPAPTVEYDRAVEETSHFEIAEEETITDRGVEEDKKVEQSIEKEVKYKM